MARSPYAQTLPAMQGQTKASQGVLRLSSNPTRRHLRECRSLRSRTFTISRSRSISRSFEESRKVAWIWSQRSLELHEFCEEQIHLCFSLFPVGRQLYFIKNCTHYRRIIMAVSPKVQDKSEKLFTTLFTKWSRACLTSYYEYILSLFSNQKTETAKFLVPWGS